MARLHFAYTFNPVAFADSFRGVASRGEPEFAKELLVRSRAALRSPDATLREALEAVRYSDDWLDDDSDEDDLHAKRFLICLLEKCASAPSLGRSGEPLYYLGLDPVPGMPEWGSSELHSLLHGDTLNSYLESAGLSAILPWLSGLNDLGGWLGFEHASALKAKLGKTGIAHAFTREARLRACNMLNEINDSNRALFLVLD